MDFGSSTGRLSIFLGYFLFIAFTVGLVLLYRHGWRESRLGLAGLRPGPAIAIGIILFLLLAFAIA
ncbi:hypothetical protein [Sphingomonas daechungensis]|uniref:hypothetical protein n=1 Tax=Sphingomonas daechungensis TaxID=1176646 RepID=UPI003783D77B